LFYEAKKTVSAIDTLIAIVAFFDVSLDYLMGCSGLLVDTKPKRE
jgi:hypothetical protein